MMVSKNMYTTVQTLLVCLGFLFCGTTAFQSNFILRDDYGTHPSPQALHLELGRSLSKKAALSFPGQSLFTNLTTRWDESVTPEFYVSVEVGTAEDVATIVKFANKYDIDFLAVNRAHGTARALSNVRRGIQINLRQLRDISVAKDGNSVTLGGGAYTAEVVSTLASIGKASASGACACPGLMGLGLGGGYSRYGGFYGLVLDNIIDMNVVLANGTSVFVSATSNPDLYWAMRGAGHNFGIVTKFNYKIHDEISPTWYLSTVIFKGDKVVPVVNALNKQIANGTMPAHVVNLATFLIDPTISTTEPVIVVDIHYIGTAAQGEPYAKPFWDLGPVSIHNFTTSYPENFYAGRNGLYDPICHEPLGPAYLFPIGLQTYNASIMAQLYKLYADKVTKNPKFSHSAVLLEGYSLGAVKAVDSASTAFAHRDDNILVGFLAVWPLNSGLDTEAAAWGKEVRALIQGGVVPARNPSAYVNYAHGDEPLKAIYGYEPWRLEKLRKLKKQYDPDFKFRFYNPIH